MLITTELTPILATPLLSPLAKGGQRGWSRQEQSQVREALGDTTIRHAFNYVPALRSLSPLPPWHGGERSRHCWPSPSLSRPAAGTPNVAEGPPAARAKRARRPGSRSMHPEKRDIRMTVIQPGTIQAYEVAPIYSRIAGYVQKYNFNIGDRVKTGDVLVEMWIPDYVEQLSQKSATVEACRSSDQGGRKCASGRRSQSRNGQGSRASRPTPESTCSGELRSLGLGVQAARDAGATARPRRSGS